MSTYYSTVFFAVLTMVGIQVAVLVFTAQTVGARFTTRRSQKFLYGKYAIGYWALAFTILLVTGAALVADAFPHSAFGRCVDPLISLARFGIIPLAGLSGVLLLFLKVMANYSTYLSPIVAVREIASELSPITIRNLALFRLDVQPEKDFYFLLNRMPEQASGNTDSVLGRALEEPQESLSEQDASKIAEVLEHVVETNPEGKDDEITTIKMGLSKRASDGDLEDPLAELADLAVSMLRERNLWVWRAILSKWCDAFHEVADGDFYSSKAIPFRGDELLAQHMRELFVEAAELKRGSFAAEIVTAASRVITGLINSDNEYRARPFLELIAEIGDRALELQDPVLFGRAVDGINSIAIDFTNVRETRDEATRRLGWLAEKLLRRGPEQDTRIPVDRTVGELGAIIEALSRLTGAIEQSKERVYPDVLAYVIEVICDGILALERATDYETRLISLLGSYGRLANLVVVEQDEFAVFFANRYLLYLLQVSKRNLSNFKELESDIYEWLRDLILAAIPNNQENKRLFGEFKDKGRDLLAVIIERLAEFPNARIRDSQMQELSVKGIGLGEKLDEFLERAAKALGSDFGMNPR